MLHTTAPPRPLTKATPDVHKLRSLTPDERRELRDRGVYLETPHEESYHD